MRTIPGAILERIRKLQQTHAEGADPRINLVMQRTKKYIEQGSMLEPFDLWEGSNLGPLSVAYRRENRMTGPDRIFLAYIEGGIAYLATIPYVASIEARNVWTPEYAIGPATNIAIEFNGHWERTHKDADICFDSPAAWTLVTDGDPYIFVVKTGGSLTVQQGQDIPFTLATGVTKVAALRSWKNTALWNHDQGLICAYIRGGDLYYRNFANQGTDANPLPAIWDEERKVDHLSPAQNVALCRTNDYRTGILAEMNGEIYLSVTERNWAAMAVEPHTVTGGISVEVSLDKVTRTNLYHKHTVTGGISVSVVMLYGAKHNEFAVAENEDYEIVRATVKHLLTDPDPLEFTILDEEENVFDCLGAEIDPLAPRTLILTFQNLNYSAEGDLTLKFLGSVTAKGEAGQSFDPFEITFTPEGLEYVEVSGPEVEAIWNE